MGTVIAPICICGSTNFGTITERVLSPAAHAVALPLYNKEVADALILIAKLEKCFS